MIFCLFVYCFSSLFEIFSFIRRDQQNHRRAAELDLCSALMAIKHWNFFGVPHLLWHGISVLRSFSKSSCLSQLLSSVCQSCIACFDVLGLLKLGVHLVHARQTIKPPALRSWHICVMRNIHVHISIVTVLLLS